MMLPTQQETFGMPDTPALFSLPLFPLGTVLYPGGFLPLQIFEVRYLDMIGKCHKTDAPFGVVSLIQGTEVRRPGDDGRAGETFHAVGTLASITEFSAPQPGLMMIRCTGTQRFGIARSEKLRHGLWIADVSLLPDDPVMAIPEDLKGVAQALSHLISTLRERATPAAQMPVQAPYRLDDCAWVANRWCELLPLAPELKQRLMALDSPLLRLELVSDILERSGILM